MNKKIGVLGGGSWATSIIKMLCENIDSVNWWMRNEEVINHISELWEDVVRLKTIIEDEEWRTEQYRNGNRVYGFVDEEDDALEDYVNSLFGGSDIMKSKN